MFAVLLLLPLLLVVVGVVAVAKGHKTTVSVMLKAFCVMIAFLFIATSGDIMNVRALNDWKII